MKNQSALALKVGIATFLMLAAIAGLLIWKSSLLLKITGYELIGSFENVAGLLPGANVQYRGYTVGKVARVIPGPRDIKVYFWIEKEVHIPHDSTLKVIFDGLIGERFLTIIPDKKSTNYYVAGDIIPGYSTSSLADFVEVGTQNLEQTKQILGAINRVLATDEVLGSVKNAVINIERMTRDMSLLVEDLRDASSGGGLRQTVENFRGFSENLKLASDELVRNGNFVQNLNQSMANINQLTSDYNQFVSKDQPYSRVNTILTNFEDVSGELKSMIKDNDLKTDVKLTLKETQKLFKDSGNLVTTLGALDISGQLDMQYLDKPQKAFYSADMDVRINRLFIRAGVADRRDHIQRLNFQQGVFITDRLAARFGMFYSQPGVGVDVYPTDWFRVKSDLYNFNTVVWDLTGYYRLLKYMDLSVSANDIFHATNRTYGIGVNLHPKLWNDTIETNRPQSKPTQ